MEALHAFGKLCRLRVGFLVLGVKMKEFASGMNGASHIMARGPEKEQFMARLNLHNGWRLASFEARNETAAPDLH